MAGKSDASSDGPPTLEFLEEVLKHIAHPIFVKDREHRWVWVNDAFCELAGASAAALRGKTDHDFVPHEQAEHFHRKDREVFSGGRTVTVDEEPFTDLATRRHWLATTKVPLRSESGEITHLVGIIHDITRLKDVEEDLRLSNEQLERRVSERARALEEAQQSLLRRERLVVLGQLSGGVAHQIRNPLSAISNAAAVIRKKLVGHPDPELHQALDIISEEVWAANRIITDLIEFARVLPATPVSVAVDHLVRIALHAAKVGQHIEVRESVPADLEVFVDERQTRDALANVIRNAVEAMGAQGTLTIEAERAPSCARISVEDTGPGLTPSELANLFEPLVTNKPLGLGLGLPTAKALIENQGGEIRAESSARGGARFEIFVPLTVD